MSKELRVSPMPLQLRRDIRDKWDSPDSSVHTSISALNKILGYTITPSVEWPILWGAVKDQFPDNTTFVPLVVRYTIAWYERLMGRLENPACEEWTDQLLNTITESSKAKALSLHIEPSEDGVSLPGTKWNAKLAAFKLFIPKAEPVSQIKLDSTYDKCLENLFNADEGWADLATETYVPTPPTIGAGPSEERLSVTRLPVLDALARPPDLFKSTGPYTLIVEERSPQIVVQCSHEPSLELIVSYFTKWGKTNPIDSERRNILRVQLVESEYCYGVFDTVTIERTMGRRGDSINPVMLLAFIEVILRGSFVWERTGGQPDRV
ncbi:hypothetical protein DFH08DRAFT_814288 [Mycena albidolilacea]|uniref:Uncharacterized protein n=1 Tax=Mycena albidolilacea TaxID=1033008 RepID=A0AAD7EL27_9AGAR|nr:hypothetical protein DFH08DRAFT_814288 [Mycena albidolilacea]